MYVLHSGSLHWSTCTTDRPAPLIEAGKRGSAENGKKHTVETGANRSSEECISYQVQASQQMAKPPPCIRRVTFKPTEHMTA